MRRLIGKLKTWLVETHSVRFELQRHFLLRFFDLEVLSQPADWKALVGGTVALLGPLSHLWAQGFFHKYIYLNSLDDAAPYRRAVVADVLFIIVLAMLVTGIVTTLQWPSLFPGLRDYLALASLPIRARDVFAAHFAAVLTLALIFTNVMVSSPSVLMPMVMAGRHGSTVYRHIPGIYLAGSLAGWFTFFLLVAIQGVLLNLVPRRRFSDVSLSVQSVLILALFCLVPWALRIPELQYSMDLRPNWAAVVPPLWFLGLDQFIAGNHDPYVQKLAARAVEGTVGAFLIALATYIWSYGRHRAQVIEGPTGEKDSSRSRVQEAFDRLLSVPQEQAIFSFVTGTVVRSRTHRFVAAIFVALGFAIFSESIASQSGIRKMAIFGPLALSLFLLCGYRYLARLPFELRANWIFRYLLPANEKAARTGIAKLFLYCGVVPLSVAILAIQLPLLGLSRGLLAGAACILATLILYEGVLARNEIIPFTSAYLPGRRSPLQTAMAYAVGLILFVWVLGAVIEGALSNKLVAWILVPTLATAWWKVRRTSRKITENSSITFEELPESAVQTLSITCTT